MNDRTPLSAPLKIVLGLVVCAMLWLRLTVDFNTPYLDECDYIFVGRVLLSGGQWQTQTYIFSSNFPLYVMGLADKAAALVGEGYLAARILACLLGAWSLWCYYRAVSCLFDNKSTGAWATLLFALQAPHIFISKFATYDIVCMAWFAPAMWMLACALRSAQGGIIMSQGMPQNEASISLTRPMFFALAATVLLLGAILSKYIALAYAPLLVVVLWIARHRVGAVVATLLGASVLSAYVWYYRAELWALYHNHILGDHKANSTYLQILGIIASYCGLLVVLIGSLWLWLRTKTTLLNVRLYVGLAVFSLPLLLYHLYTRDLLSLNKHAVYGVFFLAPIAADLLRAGFDAPLVRRTYIQLVAAGCSVLVLAVNWYHVYQMEHAFPRTASVVERVKQSMTPQTTIMSEDPYLFRYHFYPTLDIPQLAEMSWFDNNADGKFEQQDVIDALWDGKFEYVYINEQIVPYELRLKLIEGVLPHSYDKIYEEPYSISQVMNRHNAGIMRLYKRRY
jgi:hypothetical protein